MATVRSNMMRSKTEANQDLQPKVNTQLQQMLAKLKQKVQNEVQQRIENQRKLNNNLQQMGLNVSDQLMFKFDKQIKALNQDVDNFEEDLANWELSMQRDLNETNFQIARFSQDCEASLANMSMSMNDKYKLTQEYQDKVNNRIEELRETVFSPFQEQGCKSIPQLENDRNNKELELTEDVLSFNQRVTKQVKQLETTVMGEITGIQTELSKEETRRIENDQQLLLQVNQFLSTLTTASSVAP